MLPLLTLVLAAASTGPGPMAIDGGAAVDAGAPEAAANVADGGNPCAVLDLASALGMIERHSDEVAIKRAEVHAAEADQALASALRILPEFTATLIGGPVPAAHGNITTTRGSPESQGTSNRTVNGLGPFFRVDANAIQPIWTWGQIDAANDAAAAGLEARQLLVRDQLHTVQLRIVQLFWAQVMARKLLSFAAEVEDALQTVDKKIEESLKKQEGDISTEDRYRVKLFHGVVTQKKAEAKRGLEQARIGLAATLALDPSGVQFEAPPFVDTGGDLPELKQLLADAEASRPDLKALDQAIRAREDDLKANEAAMYPALFLAGQFSFAYAGNRDLQTNPWVNDPFREIGGGVVVGLRENLALPMTRAKIMKSEAELDSLRAQRTGAHRLVAAEIEAAHADAVAAQEKLAGAQGSLAAGKAWFRSSTLNFGLGVVDGKAVLDAFAGYVQTQIDLATATYDLLVARARLDQLTGKSLAKGEGKCMLP